MKLEDGDIIAGVGISNINLNITKKELLDIIGKDYSETKLKKNSIITIENAVFWIDSDGRVNQIGVCEDFKGKYKKVIGIGSSFADVKRYAGNHLYECDNYSLEDDEGVSFEFEVTENEYEWIKLEAPVEYIFVFRDRKDKLCAIT